MLGERLEAGDASSVRAICACAVCAVCADGARAASSASSEELIAEVPSAGEQREARVFRRRAERALRARPERERAVGGGAFRDGLGTRHAKDTFALPKYSHFAVVVAMQILPKIPRNLFF